ncbi:MFS transporter, partial [Pseudonocardia kongjuensis]|uniref:MFS transporter n=1 Tax=Pseudonocardia kongjuensis TaxID=102227 RepID=UPI0031DA4CE6
MTGGARADRPGASSVLWVTSFGLLLVLVNGTSVNVALPELSAAFDAPAGVADWFLLAFMLANTASILIFGRISDMIGRKRIFLGGMAGFMVASALAVLAPNAATFVLLRALQGVAAATIVANTTAIIADAYPRERLAQALSVNMTAAAVGNTLGPAIGGVLVSTFGWTSVFLINLPFGLVALLLGIRLIPGGRPHGAVRERFDVAGAVLSVACLTAVIYAINRSATAGLADPLVLGVGLAGVLAGVLFVLVERRSRHPLVDPALVRDLRRACAYAAAYFNSCARAGITVLVVLHQQIVGGRSAAEAGAVLTALALAMMTATPLTGRLSRVLTARAVSAGGGLLLVVGLAGSAASTANPSMPVAAAWLVVVGLGVGFFTAPNTEAIMAGVAPRRRAVANSVRSMLYNSGQAVGTSVSLLIVVTGGVGSYAGQTDDGPVVLAFSVAMGVSAGAAALALLFAVLRGGSFRSRRPAGGAAGEQGRADGPRSGPDDRSAA